MSTEPATKEEVAWMRKVTKLLKNPPSDRLGLYTVGDRALHVYDKRFDYEINRLMDNRNARDFCCYVDELGAELGQIDSATGIHSTAG